MKYKLTMRQFLLLCEAFRRFECFAVRKDNCKWDVKAMQESWTGLGTKSQYIPVSDNGLMKQIHNGQRIGLVWWQLTESGANIILAWHNAGYAHNSNHELNFQPPLECEGMLNNLNITASLVLDG